MPASLLLALMQRLATLQNNINNFFRGGNEIKNKLTRFKDKYMRDCALQIENPQCLSKPNITLTNIGMILVG